MGEALGWAVIALGLDMRGFGGWRLAPWLIVTMGAWRVASLGIIWYFNVKSLFPFTHDLIISLCDDFANAVLLWCLRSLVIKVQTIEAFLDLYFANFKALHDGGIERVAERT